MAARARHDIPEIVPRPKELKVTGTRHTIVYFDLETTSLGKAIISNTHLDFLG